MKNYTNQILELADGKNYFVIRQAVYNDTTYFFAVEVTPDNEDFTNNFLFLEKVDEGEKFKVKEVTDKKIIEILAKNIKIKE